MYKVKIFNESSTGALEQAVNNWLQANKEIIIHNSNLSAAETGSLHGAGQAFFILYSGPAAQANELKEIAVAAVQDQSIEVKEINPEILKPSS